MQHVESRDACMYFAWRVVMPIKIDCDLTQACHLQARPHTSQAQPSPTKPDAHAASPSNHRL